MKWNGNAWVCASDEIGGGGSFWSLAGNSITGGQFLGTTNNTAFVIKVNKEKNAALIAKREAETQRAEAETQRAAAETARAAEAERSRQLEYENYVNLITAAEFRFGLRRG